MKSRKDRAAQTRRRMCEAGYALFSEAGYGPTTMAQVAARAGVAVQTVYFTFHTKAALFTEVVQYAAGGVDRATPVMQRAWIQDVLACPDGQRALALCVEHGTEIFRRMAPLWDAMVSATAADREFAERFAGIVNARRMGIQAVFASMERHGELRVPAYRAADTYFLVHTPQVFSMATQTLGWTVERLKAWTFVQHLPLLRRSTWDPGTTSDLAFHAEIAELDPPR